MKRKIKKFVFGVTAFVSFVNSKKKEFSKTVKPSKRTARYFPAGYPRTKEERMACRPELYKNFADVVRKFISAKDDLERHSARKLPRPDPSKHSYIVREYSLETEARIFWAQMARWKLLPIDRVRGIRWRDFNAFIEDITRDPIVLENIQKLPKQVLSCA